MVEKAWAKLNLSLDVLGRREDGYHSLCMVMETIDLADDVRVELRRDGELRLDSSLAWLPRDGRNLALQAAALFRESLGEPGLGADIYLEKHIPVGAGMAGGSSDAAAVLRALNALCGSPFDGEGLRALGLRLGSDVPYCIEGGSRLAEGRGERLRPLPQPPPCGIVLGKPDFSVSTAELFSRVDGRRSPVRPDTAGLEEALRQGDLPGLARRMYNVFEDVLPRHCAAVSELRGELLEAGALGAVMTGTGSAVFGLFADGASARRAAEGLRPRWRDVFAAQFREPLHIEGGKEEK